jgi:hypothetical protein
MGVQLPFSSQEILKQTTKEIIHIKQNQINSHRGKKKTRKENSDNEGFFL